jgi:hypothetical protein
MTILLDTFVDADERERVSAVLGRRTRYLVSRANTVAERAFDGATPSWQPKALQLALWSDAAESSAVLGRYEEARGYLRRAVRLLLELELPFGAALQRAFFAEEHQLVQSTERIMALWARQSDDAAPALGEEQTREGSLANPAYETDQQWAYFALAEAGIDIRRVPPTRNTAGVRARADAASGTPVGRMRLPMRQYFVLADVSSDAIRQNGKVVSRRQVEAADVIATSLTALYRALRWGKIRDGEMSALFGVIPLFDLDTALLTARGLDTRETLKNSLADRAVRMTHKDARDYAST